jgi:hypothetical protein
MKPSYSDLLQDPLWQKKRLEIFNRDDFCCQKCYDTKNTLHVHHKSYIPDNKPWEYPNGWLITLCKKCHEFETAYSKEMLKDSLDFLKLHFLPSEIDLVITAVCHGLYYSGVTSDVFISIMEHFLLSNKNKNFSYLKNKFFKDIRKQDKQ